MIRRQPPKGATQHSFYRRRRIKVIFLAVHCVGGLRPRWCPSICPNTAKGIKARLVVSRGFVGGLLSP